MTNVSSSTELFNKTEAERSFSFFNNNVRRHNLVTEKTLVCFRKDKVSISIKQEGKLKPANNYQLHY